MASACSVSMTALITRAEAVKRVCAHTQGYFLVFSEVFTFYKRSRESPHRPLKFTRSAYGARLVAFRSERLSDCVNAVARPPGGEFIIYKRRP